MDLDISRLSYQGLIQKEKVDINCEKGAQIRVVAKNIVTQGWSNIMVMKHKEAIHYICFSLSCHYVYIMIQYYGYEAQRSYTLYLFFTFLSLCLYYVTCLIKKLDYVYWLLLFLIRIKFGLAKISVAKNGISVLKTACINPWYSLILKGISISINFSNQVFNTFSRI